MTDKEKIILYFNSNEMSLDDLYALEDKLESVLKKGGIGKVDGHEISDDGRGKIFLYGADMEQLLLNIKPVLEKIEFSKIKIFFPRPESLP